MPVLSSRIVSCCLVAISVAFGSSAAFADMEFTAREALNENAATDTRSDFARASIVSNGNEQWIAVWESKGKAGDELGKDSDIFVARSAGNAGNWTDPVPLNSNAASDSGDDRTPVVAGDGDGNWVAVWWSDDTLDGTIKKDWDILTSHSKDNGLTWSSVAPLNTNAAVDLETDAVPTVDTDGVGTWLAVWEAGDTIGGPFGSDLDLFVARSTDNGKTWTDPVPLNSNALTDPGSDYVPSMATDGNGNWVVAWDSLYFADPGIKGGNGSTDQDILMCRSSDNGITWSPPAPLNSNADSDTERDYYPNVTTDGKGTWVVGWDSKDSLEGAIGNDEDILVSRSTDNGATWSAQIALNTNAAVDVGFDTFVSLATDRQGVWVAVWMSGDTLNWTIGTDVDVLRAQSDDAGVTWSAPSPLNSNATNDDTYDGYPTISADSDGHWIAAWESRNSLGGTIGHDYDLLFVTSPIPNGSLKLMSPNGGERWKAGKKRMIEWTSIGDPGSNVSIELFRKGKWVSTIDALTPNDGSLRWSPLDALDAGSGYSVRVNSATDTSITDESNSTFRIRQAK